jgi:predicted membrane protein
MLSSSICLVHCLATPVLVTLGAGFFAWPGIKYLFLVISFFSVYYATRESKHTRIAAFLWICFWGFLFSSLFHEGREWLHYLNYFFSLLIITGHLLHLRRCRKCNHPTASADTNKTNNQ